MSVSQGSAVLIQLNWQTVFRLLFTPHHLKGPQTTRQFGLSARVSTAACNNWYEALSCSHHVSHNPRRVCICGSVRFRIKSHRSELQHSHHCYPVATVHECTFIYYLSKHEVIYSLCALVSGVVHRIIVGMFTLVSFPVWVKCFLCFFGVLCVLFCFFLQVDLGLGGLVWRKVQTCAFVFSKPHLPTWLIIKQLLLCHQE